MLTLMMLVSSCSCQLVVDIAMDMILTTMLIIMANLLELILPFLLCHLQYLVDLLSEIQRSLFVVQVDMFEGCIDDSLIDCLAAIGKLFVPDVLLNSVFV